MSAREPGKPGAERAAPVLAAVVLLVAFLAAVFPISNYDIGFHVKTGQVVAQTGSIPSEDPFSATHAGEPWPLHQWLPALLFYRVFEAAGVGGLIVLKAGIVALIFALTWLQSRRRGASVWPAAAACAIAILVARERMLVRPFIFSLFFLASSAALLEAYFRGYGRRAAFAAALLLPVWANVHAGWIYGVLLWGAMIGGVSIDHLWPRGGGRRTGWLSPEALFLVACLGAGVLASFLLVWWINPSGLKVLLLPVQFGLSPYYQSSVEEFRAVSPALSAYWVMLLLAAIALGMRWRDMPARDGFTLLLFGVLSVVISRLSFAFAIVAAPILAESATRLRIRLEPASGWRRVLKVNHLARVALAACVLVFAKEAAGFGGPSQRPLGFGFSSGMYPHGAYRFIDSKELPGVVFNEDAWGGSFIWAFWPERKPFIDNRLEVYGEDFYRNDYLPVQCAQEGWEDKLESYDVSFLLLRWPRGRERLARAALDSPRWSLVYWDDLALVFLKSTDENRPWLERYSYREVDPLRFKWAGGDPGGLVRQEKELRRALHDAPDSVQALNYLGIVYAELGDYRASRRIFERALALAPRDLTTRKNLALLKRRLLKLQSASLDKNGQKMENGTGEARR